MALRIKSHWWNDQNARSLPEIATVLAATPGAIALDKAITLRCERFVYVDDRQRLAVIAEYLAFLVQIGDRLAYRRLDQTQRRELITAFARKLFEHV